MLRSTVQKQKDVKQRQKERERKTLTYCIACEQSLVSMLLKNNEQQTRCIIYRVVRAGLSLSSCNLWEQGMVKKKGDVDFQERSQNVKICWKRIKADIVWFGKDWHELSRVSGFRSSQPPHIGSTAAVLRLWFEMKEKQGTDPSGFL